MVEAVWEIWLELAPWLLVGALVAGLLHAFVPAEFLRTRLQGKWGVVKGALLGVPMPLCSCAVIPAGLGLKRQGASDGATVAFMISTPQTGADSLLVARAFLGWPFALFSLASSFVLGIVAGLWADAQGAPSTGDQQTPPTCAPATHANKLIAVWEMAVETLRSIWRWLVFGVLASAAIEMLVPPGSLQRFAGAGGWAAMLAALVIGMPLYVCTTASVPMAAALVHAGFPPGAALVFLIAGPATNVATMGAVYRVLGRRNLAIYLATIAVGSVAFGLLFDLLIDATAGAQPAAHHHDHPTWWAVASAGLLLAMMAWFAAEDLRDFVHRRRGVATDTHAGHAHNEPSDPGRGGRIAFGSGGSVTVDVAGMTCANCVSELKRAIAREPGVRRVEVTLTPGRALVHGEISPERVRELVERAGFRTG